MSCERESIFGAKRSRSGRSTARECGGSCTDRPGSLHALPLPGFLLLVPNIYSHAVSFTQSEPLAYPLFALIPKAWAYLFCNTVMQYVCIRSVYVLTTECSSLTVTLVITLRKFVSLLLSLYYFQNPFTAVHWFGTALVFTGTLVFTEVFPRLRAAVRPPLKAD
ncbi:UDP-xylose and UDP-N-acetylglucosamine transporter [Ixodes scapularis]